MQVCSTANFYTLPCSGRAGARPSREGRNLLHPLRLGLAGELEERGGQVAVAARILLKVVLVVVLGRVEVDERQLLHGERLRVPRLLGAPRLFDDGPVARIDVVDAGPVL